MTSLHDLLLASAKGSIDYSIKFPVGNGFIVVSVTGDGKLFVCCNKDTKTKQLWCSASVGFEVYYELGFKTETPNSVPVNKRNNIVPDPCNPFKTVKLKNLEKARKKCPPSKKEPGGGNGIGGSVTRETDCPGEFWEGSGELFIRAKAGVGFGFEASIQYKISLDTPLSLENLSGSFHAGWVGGAGATVDAGGGAEGAANFKVEDRNESCCH